MSAVTVRQPGRPGFSNATLLLAVAVLIAAILLSMVSSGEVDPGGLLAASSAAGRTKPTKSKPPPVIPPGPVAALPQVASNGGQFTDPIAVELCQALARMNSQAAAGMLVELDTPTVVKLLQGQRERDLARILEAADAVDAAQWSSALLEEAGRRRLAAERSLVKAVPTVGGDLPAEQDAAGENPPVITDMGTAPDDGAVPEESPDTEEPGSAAEDVPAENGSSAAGAAKQLVPGTNIA